MRRSHPLQEGEFEQVACGERRIIVCLVDLFAAERDAFSLLVEARMKRAERHLLPRDAPFAGPVPERLTPRLHLPPARDKVVRVRESEAVDADHRIPVDEEGLVQDKLEVAEVLRILQPLLVLRVAFKEQALGFSRVVHVPPRFNDQAQSTSFAHASWKVAEIDFCEEDVCICRVAHSAVDRCDEIAYCSELRGRRDALVGAS
mmetsp:Transcript_70196/g.166630  ORF Transcript_70196/g.166630 Transcript_70196/m.166630 type:complete len:203 (-) Transcript_70196:480-1088(-)